MIDKPVWLLDVDGVINANRPRWGGAPLSRSIYVNGQDYKIRWAPELMLRIRTLVRMNKVDLVWCSTWCPFADQLESLWSLPELPRALTNEQCTGHPYDVETAKLQAAFSVRANNKKLIWTDDQVVPEAGSSTHKILTVNKQAVLIKPKERSGLLRQHMDLIEKFVLDI